MNQSMQYPTRFPKTVLSQVFLALPLAFILIIIFGVSSLGSVFPKDKNMHTGGDRPTYLGIGIGAENFNYSEYESGQLMEEKGLLTNLNLSTRLPLNFDLLGQDYTFVQVKGSLAKGGLTYEGETWGGDSLTTNTQDSIYNLKGYLGFSYSLGEAEVEPYGGFFLRYWGNEILGQGGYRRKITQLFWSSGVEVKLYSSKSFSLSVSGSGHSLSFGIVKSHLSDVNSSFNDPAVSQNQGYGLNGSLELWSDLMGLPISLEVYGLYLNVAESTRSTLYYNESKIFEVQEPDNTTLSYGVNFSFYWGRSIQF